MTTYSLSHLTDRALLRDLNEHVRRDRTTTASLIAHLGGVDARRLYLPAGFPSMHAYCVHELRLSEDAAHKRIRAARAVREFPGIFEALAEGRLNLNGVVLLKPHLTQENAAELIAAASHKLRSELEKLLAERFPSTEMLTMTLAAAPTPVEGRVEPVPAASGPSSQLAARPVAGPRKRDRLVPVAPNGSK